MPGWEQAWADALDALELDVARAEGLLASYRTSPGLPAPVSVPWAPPNLPGPLPASLRARAQAVLDRQTRVAAELARGIGAARRDLLLAQRLDTRAHAPAPAFLDTRF
jgi:hypothetical protein